MPKIIIRLENLAIFIIAFYWIYNYSSFPNAPFFMTSGGWYLFILIWLSFDISMVGYLYSKKIGAVIYNLVHNYLLVILLVVTSILISSELLMAISLILASHVSLDRLMGYGLKYSSDFKHTHIQKL